MAINNPIVTDSEWLQATAVAIQNKDGGGKMEVPDFASRIKAIPLPVEKKDVNFYDWEGTLLFGYSVEEVQAMTSLPAPDTSPNYQTVDHDLLTFQEWNWSLADIKTWVQSHKSECLDVGAIYTTTDGQDHDYWGNPRLTGVLNINMKKMGNTGGIPTDAFNNYSKLSAISLPYGVTVIGSQAFMGCNLKMINVPSTVTNIRFSAFFNNYTLKQINFSNNIKLGIGFFQQCYSLEKANIPNGTTAIGEYFFLNCYSLKNVTISSTVIAIGQEAFRNCRNLPKIEIPDSVTSIGDSAFVNCSYLCDILLKGKPTLSNTNAFSGLPTNYRIYIPRSYLSWFKTATNWSSIYTARIVAIEDYINYLESLGFDVDKYKEVTA